MLSHFSFEIKYPDFLEHWRIFATQVRTSKNLQIFFFHFKHFPKTNLFFESDERRPEFFRFFEHARVKSERLWHYYLKFAVVGFPIVTIMMAGFSVLLSQWIKQDFDFDYLYLPYKLSWVKKINSLFPFLPIYSFLLNVNSVKCSMGSKNASWILRSDRFFSFPWRRILAYKWFNFVAICFDFLVSSSIFTLFLCVSSKIRLPRKTARCEAQSLWIDRFSQHDQRVSFNWKCKFPLT